MGVISSRWVKKGESQQVLLELVLDSKGRTGSGGSREREGVSDSTDRGRGGEGHAGVCGLQASVGGAAAEGRRWASVTSPVPLPPPGPPPTPELLRRSSSRTFYLGGCGHPLGSLPVHPGSQACLSRRRTGGGGHPGFGSSHEQVHVAPSVTCISAGFPPLLSRCPDLTLLLPGMPSQMMEAPNPCLRLCLQGHPGSNGLQMSC